MLTISAKEPSDSGKTGDARRPRRDRTGNADTAMETTERVVPDGRTEKL